MVPAAIKWEVLGIKDASFWDEIELVRKGHLGHLIRQIERRRDHRVGSVALEGHEVLGTARPGKATVPRLS